MLNNNVGRPALQCRPGHAGLLAGPASHTINTIAGRFAGLTFGSATHATINRVSRWWHRGIPRVFPQTGLQLGDLSTQLSNHDRLRSDHRPQFGYQVLQRRHTNIIRTTARSHPTHSRAPREFFQNLSSYEQSLECANGGSVNSRAHPAFDDSRAATVNAFLRRAQHEARNQGRFQDVGRSDTLQACRGAEGLRCIGIVGKVLHDPLTYR